MLNKDQYDQEEYNNYYRQESEGVDREESVEESGTMGKLIIFFVILALAIVGYFGYKAMSNASDEAIDTSLQISAESSLPESLQESVTEPKPLPIKEEVSIKEPTPTEEPVAVEEPEAVKSVESTVITEVTKQGKMSPEEIATVVTAVMEQLKEQKSKESAPVTVKKDALLMDKLSQSEVDSVSSDLVQELEEISMSENTKIDNSQQQVDVYNKVNIQNSTETDSLSQLSDEIEALTREEVKQDKVSNYTNALKDEINVRQNEMRIIVVQKGDTLGKIAQRAYGNVMDYKKIYRANPEVTRADRIYIGQKLRIPNE